MAKPDRRTGTRVNLTLTDDVIQVLDRMSAVTGSGRATLIREFLADSLPIFSQLADAMEAASKQSNNVLSMVSSLIQEQTSRLQQLDLEIQPKRRRAPIRKRNK